MLDSGPVKLSSQPIRLSVGSCTILDRPISRKSKWVLTPESFNDLLLWLDQDRNQAAQKYESIYYALVKRFRQLGVSDPEELADQTMDRVARKLPTIISNYKGERKAYFFSLAYYVYIEYLRRAVITSLPTTDFPHPNLPGTEELFEKELLDSCLEHCLAKLDAKNRDLIREYYHGDRRDKIRSRKELAGRLGITLAYLRLKAQRVRTELKSCILDCLERQAREGEAIM